MLLLFERADRIGGHPELGEVGGGEQRAGVDRLGGRGRGGRCEQGDEKAVAHGVASGGWPSFDATV